MLTDILIHRFRQSFAHNRGRCHHMLFPDIIKHLDIPLSRIRTVPLAAQAGLRILQAGGNAADAAAATMLALGGVNPASSGLGGGGFALYYRAEDASLTFLDFRERAPRASDKAMFDTEGERPPGPANAPSQLGGLAAGVPGEPAGIEALVHRFGKLPLRDVIAPALRLAERGFPVSEALAKMGD